MSQKRHAISKNGQLNNNVGAGSARPMETKQDKRITETKDKKKENEGQYCHPE